MSKKPTFIILGAQRCGTTALYGSLRTHPQISMRSYAHGEIHFFDQNRRYRKGIGWYEDFFRNTKPICGEKSPSYLSTPKAIARIKAYNPSIRLVILLRDPVDRWTSAWSQQFIGQRRRRPRSQYWRECRDARWRGVYLPQVSHVLDLFPKRQVGIWFTEAMRRNPKKVMGEIIAFLGADPALPFYAKRWKGWWKARDDWTERILEYYRLPNIHLRRFLNKWGYDTSPMDLWAQ